MKGRGLGRLALALLLVPGFVTRSAASPIRPAEEPPADFSSHQYIDSAGCVFTREGRAWSARLGRDGSLVCGYPPTPITRVQEQTPRSDLSLDGMGRIEAELLTAITAGMEAGDLRTAAERTPAQAPAASADGIASGADGDVEQSIIAAIAAAPHVDNAATAGLPRANPRLCALLGLGTEGRLPSLGGDPTGGYCSGPGAPGLRPRIAAVEASTGVKPVVSASNTSPSRSGGANVQEDRTASPAKTPHAKIRAPAAGASDTRRHHPSPARDIVLIPAWTRFLELGTYADERSAQAALRTATRLGLPVARGLAGKDGRRAVLAGPLLTREAAVRAHDRLSRAGFVGLLPRR